jgi:endonuclease G
MKKLLLTLLLTPFFALANPIDDQCPQFALRGAPVSKLQPGTTQYLCKQNYAIHYRYDTKTAEYVLEHITLASITGPAKRKDDFRPDPAIPKQYQSQLADYAGFPFDRGHLAPGADNTQTDAIMSESFFLSNMVPQVPNHNRGIWKQLEVAVRNWVLEGKDIYVVSGTIYAAGYQTIGAGKVGIPTHMWKVIVDRKSAKAIAFLFPNAPLPVADLPKYAVNIATIEQYTGLDFHPQLPAQLKNLETDPVNLSLWSSLR